MQIQVGAGVIIIQNNKTLLTKRIGSHAEGTYGSLGGHVEPGETPIETVKREALEELNIEIHQIKFLSCLNMIKYNKHYVDITFAATIKSGKPKIMEPNKIISVDWYDLTNLPSPLFEPVSIALKSLNSKDSYFEVTETSTTTN